jgi:hypothetical protein
MGDAMTGTFFRCGNIQVSRTRLGRFSGVPTERPDAGNVRFPC